MSIEDGNDATRTFSLDDETRVDETVVQSHWEARTEVVAPATRSLGPNEAAVLTSAEPLITYEEAAAQGFNGAIMAELAVGRIDSYIPLQRVYLVDMLPHFIDTYVRYGAISPGQAPLHRPELENMWTLRARAIRANYYQKWVPKLVERSRWWLVEEQVFEVAQALTCGDMDQVNKQPKRGNLQYGLEPGQTFEVGRAQRLEGRPYWHVNVSHKHCAVIVAPKAQAVWLQNHEPRFQTFLRLNELS